MSNVSSKDDGSVTHLGRSALSHAAQGLFTPSCIGLLPCAALATALLLYSGDRTIQKMTWGSFSTCIARKKNHVGQSQISKSR